MKNGGIAAIAGMLLGLLENISGLLEYQDAQKAHVPNSEIKENV